jgi:para-nitrobenzyl esterase
MPAVDNVIGVDGGLIAGGASADGAVRIFKGIPYAKPPVAELRWRPPQPVEPWSGVRPATSFGPRCVQVPRPKTSLGYFPTEPGSEDCLYLNVWARADAIRHPRPVMVWIHGGACNMGSGALPLFDGEALARKGVVLVTINYRLGRLGFLAHPELTAESEHRASGNYGLMDQLAALQWVQRNIATFGGDPDRVTIFGQSTGSFSVSYFTASPLTKGLFHRAIGESGSGFGPVDSTTGTSDAIQALADAEESGVELARRIGATSIAELRGRCPYEIQMARIGDGFVPGQGYDRFSPLNGRGAFDNAYFVVDGYFIPDTVRSVFARGAQHDVPLMTGSNAHERGTTVRPPGTLQGYIADARDQYGDLAERFLDLYPATTDAESLEIGGYAIGDRIFTWQSWAWVNAHARQKRSPAFYYRFTRVPPTPGGAAFAENPLNVPRSFHGAEIPYVFGSLGAREWPWEPIDHTLSDMMSSYWVNFARTGDPNGSDLPRWPAFDPSAPAAMFFGNESGLGAVPNKDRLEFWDAFYARQPTCLAEHLARR